MKAPFYARRDSADLIGAALPDLTNQEFLLLQTDANTHLSGNRS